MRKYLRELIKKNKYVTVEVKILDSGDVFNLEKMALSWDDLRKPPTRFVAYDKKGNTILLNLEVEK